MLVTRAEKAYCTDCSGPGWPHDPQRYKKVLTLPRRPDASHTRQPGLWLYRPGHLRTGSADDSLMFAEEGVGISAHRVTDF